MSKYLKLIKNLIVAKLALLGSRVTAGELKAFLRHGLLTHNTKRLRPLNIPGL